MLTNISGLQTTMAFQRKCVMRTECLWDLKTWSSWGHWKWRRENVRAIENAAAEERAGVGDNGETGSGQEGCDRCWECPPPCQATLLHPNRDPHDPHTIGTAVRTKPRRLPLQWYCQTSLLR